ALNGEPAAKPVDPDLGFWTADELARIDRGLEVLNLDRKDLDFQKQPIDDPFRLDVVRRILEHPVAIGAEAQKWDDVAKTGDVRRIFERAAEVSISATSAWGGTWLMGGGMLSKGSTDIPPPVREALERWLGIAKEARRRFEALPTR